MDYTDGAIVNEKNLDKTAQQAVFVAAETFDRLADVETLVGTAAADAAASAASALAAQGAAAVSAAAAGSSAADAAASASSIADVQAQLATLLPEIGNYAALRSYTGGSVSFYVRGVASVFDGGAGVFRVDSADTTSADNGGTILVDVLGRRWRREYAGAANLLWFAKGDGIADDTAAVAEFFSAGGGEVPDGAYLIDGIEISNRVRVQCAPSATFKKRSATAGRSRLIRFVTGSEGSEWVGGTIDGNIALFGAWVYGGVWDDWCGMAVEAAQITVQSVVYTNWLNHPFLGIGDYLSATDLRFVACATGPLFGYEYDVGASFVPRPSGVGAVGQKVRGLAIINCGDIGVAGTLQHGFDTYNPKGSTYADIVIIGLKGAASGLSTFASGVTAKLGERCTYSNIVFDSPETDAVSHLGFSFLGAVGCTFENLRAYNFAGLGLEMLDCIGCTIDGGAIDGNYRGGVTAASLSIGMIHSVGSYYRNAQSRPNAGGRENAINGLVVRRAGLGASFRAGQCSANGLRSVGNIGTGILVQETTNTASFPGAPASFLTRVMLNDCVSEFNGAQGLNAASADLVKVTGGSYSNNGQDVSLAATSRSGIVGTTLNRILASGARMDDDQSFTVTVGASFAPGNTDANKRYGITLPTTRTYTEGQYITLTNAGGAGVHHTGKIVDIDGDLATIEFSAAETFFSAGNTAALSGTWSSAGRVLSGVVGAATTEITGTMYVTDGVEWRRVEKVTNNNSIQLSEAFTATLSGASLSKLVVSVSGVPSQQYGARLFGGVVAFNFHCNSYKGNVLERMNVSTPGGAEPGSEYFRRTSITANASPLTLLGATPSGHRIVGVATNNTIAISGGGATSYDLRIVTSGNVLRETLVAAVALALNTKTAGSPQGVANFATGDRISALFNGGTPTTGQITCEALYRVDGVPALPSV